jgi:hypothetical protein
MKERTAAESTFERDFAAWLDEQAALLRARRWNDLDLPHLIEEVEDLAGNLRRELRSRLNVVLVHLLKLRYQPERRSGSWLASVYEQRARIEDLLEQSPSLRRFVQSGVEREYGAARRIAAAETALSLERFPRMCPFTVADILEGPLDERGAGAATGPEDWR